MYLYNTPPRLQIFQSICATPNFESWIRPCMDLAIGIWVITYVDGVRRIMVSHPMSVVNVPVQSCGCMEQIIGLRDRTDSQFCTILTQFRHHTAFFSGWVPMIKNIYLQLDAMGSAES